MWGFTLSLCRKWGCGCLPVGMVFSASHEQDLWSWVFWTWPYVFLGIGICVGWSLWVCAHAVLRGGEEKRKGARGRKEERDQEFVEGSPHSEARGLHTLDFIETVTKKESIMVAQAGNPSRLASSWPWETPSQVKEIKILKRQRASEEGIQVCPLAITHINIHVHTHTHHGHEPTVLSPNEHVTSLH